MSPARRRPRSRRDAPGTTPTAPAATGPSRPGFPQWRWRTFPVYFGFALGLFIGFQGGFFVGAADSGPAYLIGSVIVTTILAMGASRFWSVFLVRRGWIKPGGKQR